MKTTVQKIPIKAAAYYLFVVALLAFLCASPALRASEPENHGLAIPGQGQPASKFETSTNIAPVIVVFVVIFAAGSKLLAVDKSQDTLASQL